MFSCKYCKNFKNTYFEERLGTASFQTYLLRSFFIDKTIKEAMLESIMLGLFTKHQLSIWLLDLGMVFISFLHIWFAYFPIFLSSWLFMKPTFSGYIIHLLTCWRNVFQIKMVGIEIIQLFHDGGLYHKETRPLIWRANQWTSFYMIGTFVMKEF